MNNLNINNEINKIKDNYRKYKDGNITRREYYNILNNKIRLIKDINISFCEQMFQDIMNENDFYYIVELNDFNLVSDKGNPLRFDFCLISQYDDSKIVAIYEIDGPGHYSKNDELKNNFFDDKDVLLIRLTYEDIILKK